MPTVLRISDLSDRGYLSFDLPDLLTLVEEEAACLRWRAVPMGESMWLLAEETATESVLGLPGRVDTSSDGEELTWQEMMELSRSVHQTIWGTFIGIRPETPIQEVADLFLDEWRYLHRGTSHLYETVEIALQAVDSSFWLFYARNVEVIERVRRTFRDVELIAVANSPVC